MFKKNKPEEDEMDIAAEEILRILHSKNEPIEIKEIPKKKEPISSNEEVSQKAAMLKLSNKPSNTEVTKKEKRDQLVQNAKKITEKQKPNVSKDADGSKTLELLSSQARTLLGLTSRLIEES